MKNCDKCGREFEPRAAYHRLCDSCYRGQPQRGNWARFKRGAGDPLGALLFVVVGALVVLVLKRCGG